MRCCRSARRSSFTKGRIIVRGKLVTRGKAKRADYVLYYKPNIPIALIEAKDNTHSVGDGMQQGLDYAATLDIPFVFSSNGDGFVFHDRTGASAANETNLGLDAFPSPADLWARYRAWKGLTPEAEQIVLQDYFDDGSGKAPRYYQVNAVNAAIEAIAKGRDRILLVMATGTGKTYTAFQIIWRLWKAGRKKRILFLADRNVLIDQTMVNDFRPFGAAMAKLSHQRQDHRARTTAPTIDLTTALDKKRRIDTAYEIYLGLYQAITGPEERQKLFREFSPGFFDLIVIDECHRGSAAEDSAWREILEYFSGATQIGLTATPKETEYVSNIALFRRAGLLLLAEAGHPRRLPRALQGRQGPHRPRRGRLPAREGPARPRRRGGRGPHLQHQGLRPHAGARRPHQAGRQEGHRVPEGERRPLPEDHRLLRRSGARGADAAGARQRERRSRAPRTTATSCASPAATRKGRTSSATSSTRNRNIPVLVTTSRLLSTGVDAQTCRLIVLDREVGSMTEFKQIVGRGTRVHEDTKKFYFTLIDFRGATSHFADPDFDGEPVQIYEPGEDDPIAPPDDVPPTGEDGETLPDKPGEDETIVDGPPDITCRSTGGKMKKIYVDGVGATIIAERVEYLDENGKLVTESLARLHQEGAEEALRQPRRFPQALEGGRAQAGDHRGTGGRGPAARPDRRGTRQGPRSLRPDLPRRLRQEAAHPPRARRERQEARRVHEIRAAGPRRARCAAGQICRRGRAQSRRRQRAADRAVQRDGHAVQLIKAFGDRQGFEQAVHELQAALYQEAA